MAVRIGGEVLVWGGIECISAEIPLADGARYDPTTDTWTPVNTDGAPSPRKSFSLVWTGAEAVVWGGVEQWGLPAKNDGARYDPRLDRWVPLGMAGAPPPRTGHTALWTGSELLIWGGYTGGLEIGARWRPLGDRWRPMTHVGAPPWVSWPASVWTGDRAIVWGGTDADTGGIYDPPGAPGPIGWTIAVDKRGLGTGTVTATGALDCGSLCTVTYAAGATVTLNAVAAAGSTFAGWGGGCSGTGACTITLTEHTLVTATFASDNLDLAVSVMPAGRITSIPAGVDCNTTCTVPFPSGTVVSLVAEPAASFTGWSGDCAGTDPAVCTVTLDADRSVVASFAYGDPTFEWAFGVGGPLQDLPNAIALEPATGDVIVAGKFMSTTDFGGGPLTSAGSYDAFLARYTGTAGAHLWSQRFGAATPFPSFDSAQSVGVAPDGSLFVVGRFEGTVDFGGGALISAGGADVFVAKYAAGGGHLWSRRFGGTGTDQASGVAVDSAGDLVVVGELSVIVDFGGGSLSSGGGTDVFIAKLDGTDGAHLWSRRAGGYQDDFASAVAVDALDDVVIVGHVEQGADFGGGPLVAGQDIFVAKYDAAGGHLWSTVFDNWSGSDAAYAVATDSARNVVFAAEASTIDFGGGLVASNDEICLVKLDPDGGHLWSKDFGPGYPRAVAVGPDDTVVMTGSFDAYADFGDGLVYGTAYANGFVAKYSPGGNHIWSRVYEPISAGSYAVVGAAVTIDPAGGDVLVAGSYSPDVDLGGGPFASAGQSDTFVLRLGP